MTFAWPDGATWLTDAERGWLREHLADRYRPTLPEHVDDDAWRAAARNRPGMAVYREGITAPPRKPWTSQYRTPAWIYARRPKPPKPEPDLTPMPEAQRATLAVREIEAELGESQAVFKPLPPVSDEVRVCEPVAPDITNVEYPTVTVTGDRLPLPPWWHRIMRRAGARP